ncbi:MAG: methyl-accepting chemotaxis protein [Lachnospiraceae bacterium]|nr:methyl-accepting chemotaxis protein [Lachnospiraceae bacterium]
MKREKVRKRSIRDKILIPAVSIVVGVCAIMGLTLYQRQKEDMIRMGQDQAVTVANIAAGVIDGRTIASIQPGEEMSGSYMASAVALRNVKEKYGIADLYTLYTDGTHVYNGVDTDDSENHLVYGEESSISYREAADAFGGETSTPGSMRSSHGMKVITAYVPIFGDDAEVVAVLRCDYNAATVAERLKGTSLWVVGIGIVCIGAAVLLLLAAVRRIMVSLNRVDRKIYELVHSGGDLTKQLDIRSGDEMERIAGNVNELLAYIRDIMLRISDNSSMLAVSTNKVAANLSGAEDNITDVSAAMEQMSAAMEETTVSLGKIRDSVNAVYERIRQIAAQADSSSASSGQIEHHAARVKEDAEREQERARQQADAMIGAVKEKIARSRAVEEINELTAHIIEITEQTNLLSLNASIEAARAGEAGRGFAVVASEIGNLASDSAAAAESIRRVSTEVIAAVNELAEEAEQMLVFMENSTMAGYQELVSVSGSYRDDVRNMNHVMQQFHQDADWIEQHMDEMKEAMNIVNRSLEESARGVTEVSAKSASLTGSVGDIETQADTNRSIADRLSSEVGRFRLR